MSAVVTQMIPTPGIRPLRKLTGLGLQVLVAHEGHQSARTLRTSADRMETSEDRDARLAAADLLDWLADHPDQALHSAEALWDSLRLASSGPSVKQ